jgi:hypothetical protein
MDSTETTKRRLFEDVEERREEKRRGKGKGDGVMP